MEFNGAKKLRYKLGFPWNSFSNSLKFKNKSLEDKIFLFQWSYFEFQQLYSQWQESKDSNIKPVTVKEVLSILHIRPRLRCNRQLLIWLACTLSYTFGKLTGGGGLRRLSPLAEHQQRSPQWIIGSHTISSANHCATSPYFGGSKLPKFPKRCSTWNVDKPHQSPLNPLL